MTREAKIGMLTGLGVIVAIGVLLSEYLGDRNTGPSAVPLATGQMAPLPVGSDYRQQVLAPVSVPAMTPAGGGERTQLPGGGEVASPIATGPGGMPPTMFAADPATGAAGGAPTGPSVTGPVSAIAAGPTLMDGPSEGGPPLITLSNLTVPVKMVTPTDAAPAAKTYTIQSGDTLAKIAKKVYNASKNSDITRIVKANPGLLKDASSMLVVNKKLVIPLSPTMAVAATPAAPKTLDPGVVPVPGGPSNGLVPLPGVVQPPKKNLTALPKPDAPKLDAPKPVTPTVTTYVVQSGDTLEKIARRMAPTKVAETVVKLTTLNGIKDPSKLKVGQTLKVPA